MSKYWIKLYLEILDDPKMGRLSDHLWRRTVELFLLAGKVGEEGELPTVDEIAWALRTSHDDVERELAELSKVGIVSQTSSGWMVTSFKKRQFSESYERVKRYRGRYSNVTKGVTTTLPTSYSYSSSDSLSISEGEGTGEETNAEIFQAYEREFGGLTPMIADAILDDCKTYPVEWVREGMQIAVQANKRSWNYVRGILKNAKSKNVSPAQNSLEKSNGKKPSVKPVEEDNFMADLEARRKRVKKEVTG